MKALKFIMYIFYRYYSRSGKDWSPYFSALCAVVFLIYIHLFQLLIVFDIVDWLPFAKTDTGDEKFLKMALVMLPIFLIVFLLVRPSGLRALRYDPETTKKGGSRVIIYSILNIILLFVLMIAFSKTRN